MDTIINLRNTHHLQAICSSPINWVLLQSETFSRFGGLPDESLKDTISQLKRNRKKVVLAWDYLAKDDEPLSSLEFFKSLSEKIDFVRFLDPGLGKTLARLFPDVKLQLSLEHGSLNRYSVEYWTDIFKPSLERVVLSSQLPLATLESIRSSIPIVIEILGLGSIEIFYSRRRLLSSHLRPSDILDSNSYVASLDRPDQFNKIIQTSKGTIVFYDKPLNIFNRIPEIKKAGIDSLRIELYQNEHFNAVSGFFKKSNWPHALAECGIRDSFEGFLHSNETHQLFERLTNPIIRNEIENKIGVVFESVKNSHIVIEFTKQIRLPGDFRFISPEDKKINHRIEKIKDLKGNEYSDSLQPGIYIIPWVKYVVPGAIIRLIKG